MDLHSGAAVLRQPEIALQVVSHLRDPIARSAPGQGGEEHHLVRIVINEKVCE